jgi:hypothetical protein
MRLVSRFVLMVGVALVAAAPAAATTVAPLTVDQMTDASDVIVRGTVESVWTDLDEHQHIWTRALIHVDDALKGTAEAGDYLTVESPGGDYENLQMLVAEAARYSVGEQALLFLDDKPLHEAYGTVGMSLGKFTIRPNPADGTDMVVRFAPPEDRPYDARFIPHPPKDQRVSLQSMEDSIRARITLGWDGHPIPGISADHLRTINRVQPGVR